jgi:hypothetical protein
MSSRSKTKKVWHLLLSLVLAWGFFSLFEGIYRVAFLERPHRSVHWVVTLVAAMLTVAPGVFMILWSFRERHQVRIRRIAECFFVLALPVWGFFINQALPHCAPCVTVDRPLRSPDIAGLYILYGASVLAWAVARRHHQRLRPLAEALVMSFLLGGILLCTLLCIHLGPVIPMGVVAGPVALPMVAPPVVGIIFLVVLIRRLVRRGKEAKAENGTNWWPGLMGVTAIPLLGVWSILHKLFFEAWPQDAFTQTCGWGLSQLYPDAGDCHYLCTVAAHGHRRLVKPQRLGKRRGRPILVNRQLAVANAFEDLLHERWPRFGRMARRCYDKIGLPVSRYICKRWTADFVFLLMKPFEWFFYLVLLLLDPGDPEKRIDSMYR